MKQLQPLSTQTLTERVLDLLRERILSGDFPMGDRLIEAKIADQLRVSRGPVREALKYLQAEGLVQEEPRRGNFVIDISDIDIREIYDLRAAIETRAGRLIIMKRDPDVLLELDAVIDRLSAATEARDTQAIAACDHSFHETVCRLSGNQRLHRVFVSNTAALSLLLRLDSEHFYANLDDIRREHGELMNALRSGSIEQVEALWNEHLDNAKSRLIEFVRHRAEGQAIVTPPRAR